MKKLYFIIFILVVLVGVIGNAARIDNNYSDGANAALSTLPDNALPHDTGVSVGLDQQQLLTLSILFGTGLVGLLIVRRK